MNGLRVCLLAAALAAPLPVHAQIPDDLHDAWALRGAWAAHAAAERPALARADDPNAPGANDKALEHAAAPSNLPAAGGYTPEQIAAMINNPLGYLWLLNVQYTTTWFTGALVDRAKPLGSAQNVMLVQPVLSMQFTPGLRWLSRPIIPINSFELPNNYSVFSGQFGPAPGVITFDRITGLGDVTWMNYLATNESVKPPDIFGLGVGLKMDTATRDVLGSGKWSAGPAAVAVHLSEQWMYGVIAQHFWSFAGEAARNDINFTSLQPILRYALNEESGIGVMPDWGYNWETRKWVQLFVGLGFDTMVNVGPVPAQVGVEVHYNLVKNDLLNPQWQVRIVFTPVVPAPAWAGRPLFGD